jgi:phosphate transport system substrate-binding protein
VEDLVARILKAICVVFLTLAILMPVATDGQASTVLVVTGSSMPEPLYLLWNDEFHKQQPSVQVRYLPEGSVAGATRVLTGTGDFGGGDAPIPEKDLKGSTNNIVELPTVLVGIVVIYNLPGVTGELRLSGPVLANIFLGKVTSWNDPALVKLNPEAKLPALPIQLLHRTAGRGSNYILSDFLSKASSEFLARVGRSASPNWPAGTTAGKADDMLDKVNATPGALGYTELNSAVKASLRMASIRNADGEFVKPSVRSIAAAAKAMTNTVTDNFRISLANASGKDSYPISSFTWFYVPAVAKDEQRGRAVTDYLKWVYTSGEKMAGEQGYPPLPEELLAKVTAKVRTIR